MQKPSACKKIPAFVEPYLAALRMACGEGDSSGLAFGFVADVATHVGEAARGVAGVGSCRESGGERVPSRRGGPGFESEGLVKKETGREGSGGVAGVSPGSGYLTGDACDIFLDDDAFVHNGTGMDLREAEIWGWGDIGRCRTGAGVVGIDLRKRCRIEVSREGVGEGRGGQRTVEGCKHGEGMGEGVGEGEGILQDMEPDFEVGLSEGDDEFEAV